MGSGARGYSNTEIKSLLLPTGVLGGGQAVCAPFPRLRPPSAPVPRYKNKLRSLNVESVFTVLKSRHGVSGTAIKIGDWK